MVVDLSLTALVILVLGVTRGMQFVMNDELTKRPRAWLRKHSSYFKYSLSCPWCTGLQVGLVTVALIAPDQGWGDGPRGRLVHLLIVAHGAARHVTWLLLLAGTASLVATCVDRVIDRTPKLADNQDETFEQAPPPPEVQAALVANADRKG